MLASFWKSYLHFKISKQIKQLTNWWKIGYKKLQFLYCGRQPIKCLSLFVKRKSDWPEPILLLHRIRLFQLIYSNPRVQYFVITARPLSFHGTLRRRFPRPTIIICAHPGRPGPAASDHLSGTDKNRIRSNCLAAALVLFNWKGLVLRRDFKCWEFVIDEVSRNPAFSSNQRISQNVMFSRILVFL